MKRFSDLKTVKNVEDVKTVIDKHSSGMLTAFRGDKPNSENVSNNKKLLSILRSKGYSVAPVQGAYIENFGSDDQKEVSEPSYFVYNEKVDGSDKGALERDLKRLGEKYDQDSILTIPLGGKGAKLIGTSKRDNAWPSYGTQEVVGNAKYKGVTGQFYSKIGGEKFAFE